MSLVQHFRKVTTGSPARCGLRGDMIRNVRLKLVLSDVLYQLAQDKRKAELAEVLKLAQASFGHLPQYSE
jgi:hypothetical protein